MPQLSDDEFLVLRRLLGLSEQTNLKFGQLPDQMPVPVPLSGSAQVIGSIAIPPNRYKIVLEETLPIESVKNFYQEQLTAMQWTEQELFSSDYGLKHAPEVLKRHLGRCLNFWYEPENMKLSIEIRPDGSNASRQVTVFLNLERSLLNEDINTLKLPPFPPLADPPSALRLLSSGATYGEYASFVCFETELDLEHLYSHYKSQFETESWTPINEGRDGALIWGNWDVLDGGGETCLGLLNIVKLGGVENQYIVQLRVIRRSLLRK